MHEQLTNTNTSVTSSFSLTACARRDCVFRSRRFVLVASRKAERTFDIVSSAMDEYRYGASEARRATLSVGVSPYSSTSTPPRVDFDGCSLRKNESSDGNHAFPSPPQIHLAMAALARDRSREQRSKRFSLS